MRNDNPKLKLLPVNSPILLNNKTCPYCGEIIESSEVTKEHVIGRKFVPRGKFNGYWNLIVWACKACNNYKSKLEDDISAITMQPDCWGRHAADDDALKIASVRKGKGSISRRTGKPVIESSEEHKIKMPFGPNVEMTFTLVSPPHIDLERMWDLARLHLMGFFYFITFDYENRTGGFWPGYYMPLHEALKSDWGNPVQIGFMDEVSTWKHRLCAIGADGFFKIMIRRHPSAECWSWALEWNQKLRLIGFFGDNEAAELVVEGFQPARMHEIPQGPNQHVGLREEIALREEDDRMFVQPL